MASQMINLLTFLATEKLQPNKANYATFKGLIEEHGASKGLTGYLNGDIPEPALITGLSDIPAPTPVYSKNPSRKEWNYRNGVMKSMIVTAIADPIGLGVKRDGTAKECWDSVEAACARKSDAALSLAQSELQSIKFAGSSRDDLDALLSNVRNKANAVRMMGGTVVEKDLKNIPIRSLPADPRWLGLQGALYSATDVDDAFSIIKTVAITSGMPEHTSVVSSSTALNTSTQKRQCTNPSCKAKNRSSHTFENCYWPGGGKEGQFPANFGRNRPQANQATVREETPVVHRVLMARLTPLLAPLPPVTMEEVEDEDPLLPKAGGPRLPLGPLLRSIEDTDDDDELEDEAPVETEESVLPPPVVSEHVEHVFHVPISPTVFVSHTFQNNSPAITITFADSGASDHFFRNRSDFSTYEAIPVRTGKSALASEGDFAIVGKGNIKMVFRVDGRLVHVTFTNALHAPSLSANLVSVSQLDKAGCYSTFGGGEVSVRDGDETLLR
ncbi:hypothetical protein DFH06DRAFT_1340299 [Mycena polygramma]|nr:hypothetical protein DFH06DRAFT_1340299 [Mycena polygramma]